MNRLLSVGTAVLAVVVGLGGCGNPELEAENARLQGELEELRRERDQRVGELEGRIADLEQQNARIAELVAMKGELEAQLAEAREREQRHRERLDALRKMMRQFRDMIASGQLRVRIVRGKMVVELPEGILFDSGKAELKDEGQDTLKQVAEVLVQIPKREFLVAGHTDNVPIRTRRYPSNWHLSAARGVVVARFLAENGMPAERLAAAGYAETQPVASNDDEEGRAQNRRIEIVLMPNLDELPDLSELEDELESQSGSEAEGAEPSAESGGDAG